MKNKRKLLLIKNSSRDYRSKYLKEIKSYLIEFGIDTNEANCLVNKFKNILRNDSTYVFHYDSQYWANYIAEASGLIKKKLSLL